MPIPESEKRFPAFSQTLAVLALALLPGLARADAAADYDKGLAAYRNGDLVGAMTPLKRAADAGHAPAQALYGDILDKAEFNEQAVDYLRKAADQGDADGQYGLGLMYLSGEGVERSSADANRLIRAAAAQDHVLAINALAQAYIKGDTAFAAGERNSADARAFVLQAAASGYLPAIDALATAYREGDFGLAPDAGQADQWAAKAAAARRSATAKAAK